MFVSVALSTPIWLLRRSRLETIIKPNRHLTPQAKDRAALPLWLLRTNSLFFRNLRAWPLRRQARNTNRSLRCWIWASATFTIHILTVVNQPSAARDPRLHASWCESSIHIWHQFARLRRSKDCAISLFSLSTWLFGGGIRKVGHGRWICRCGLKLLLPRGDNSHSWWCRWTDPRSLCPLISFSSLPLCFYSILDP